MWLRDPITKLPSVSLTLLVLSTVLMVIFIFLEAFEVLHSTALLDEFFFTCTGLYFGRRFSFKGSSMDIDKGGIDDVQKFPPSPVEGMQPRGPNHF